MRVMDLVDMAFWYLKRGIAAAVFLLICIFAGYFVVYRKLLKGQKKITWRRFLWWGVLVCYLCVVLGATLLSRGSHWYNRRIQPLFFSYKDAWIHFSNAAWRNIILNFCMFILFGFWLPFGIKRLRSFWKVSLAGFVFSLLIECIQLFLRRGIFEADDIMGNTVGAMIGYGLFVLGFFLVDRKRRNPRNAVLAGLCQVPLLLTFGVFAVIFWNYGRQELGNNPYRYVEAYDRAKIHVTGENTFHAEETDLEVYKAGTLTAAAAKEKGERFFESLGTTIDESRTDVYDETIVMWSESGGYSLWINYQGGTLWFINFDVQYSEDHVRQEPVTGAAETEIRDALRAVGFEVPEEAGFRELESGEYLFEASMAETEEGIVNGSLTCKYYGKEKGIGDVSDDFITCTPYKAYAAISEQEAYEKIVSGEFEYRSDEDLEIQVMSCSLAYTLDSKGYYQPNYRFECMINGYEGEIMIPALKN